ncbi:replicative DNA helicase [Micromonospora aurantiaca]|uniref:replicative DNA helicase n=1 Tax=Micromonospora aurantiaca (nom. illeg.) TaxID=47850 RepID=UPI0034545AE7
MQAVVKNCAMPTTTASAGGSDQPIPPQDVAAEQVVLGIVLLRSKAMADASEMLEPEDFYRPVHQVIFETMREVHGRQEPVDPITVAAALADKGDLERCGGAPYLHLLVSAVPVGASLRAPARSVAEAAVRRRLLEAGHRIAQLAMHDHSGDIRDIVDLAQQAIADVSRSQADAEVDVFADILLPVLNEVEAAAEEQSGRLTTGFEDLDRLLNGLLPGHLVVIGGRSGMGKSTLAADLLRHASVRLGRPAVMFTKEMDRLEAGMRIISAEARVPLHVLRSGYLSDDDWTKLARAMSEVSDAPLFIDDRVWTIDEVRARSRRLHSRHGLSLIVVDYIQQFAKGVHDRYREVSDVTRDLKELARELQVPVVAVSQLNRGPEQRTDKRPQLVDLRDSGTVEDDADVVILLHRDDYYDKESPRAGEADLIVAKHRQGPTDAITVAAQLHLSRFVSITAAPAEETSD